MRYSYEFKLKCIKLFNKRQWAKTPEGISERNFRIMISRWAKLVMQNGSKVLKHKTRNYKWSSDQKYDLVSMVIAGRTISQVACSAGINSGTLCRWVNRFKILGYNGLVNNKKGHKGISLDMKKPTVSKPQQLNESEYEELIRLRERNAYLEAENAVIKKVIALSEKKEAALLKAKRQR